MRRDETDLDRVRTGCDDRRKNIAGVRRLGGRPATPGSAVAPGLTHSSSPYTYYCIIIIILYRFLAHKILSIPIILYTYIFFHLCLGVQTNVYRLLTEFRLTNTHTHTPIKPTLLQDSGIVWSPLWQPLGILYRETVVSIYININRTCT